MNLLLWTIPVVSALVGWFTNYLAVKMLFYPKTPWNFGLFKVQGVFPKNQRDVAEKIGKMVADELLSSKDLRDRMADTDSLVDIKRTVEERVDHFLNVRFPEQHPVINLLVSRKRKDKMKGEMMLEVEESVPKMIGHYMDRLEEKFNVEEIIQERVSKLEPERLEEMLTKLLQKEFKFIEYIGGVIGLIIGLMQVALMLLSE